MLSEAAPAKVQARTQRSFWEAAKCVIIVCTAVLLAVHMYRDFSRAPGPRTTAFKELMDAAKREKSTAFKVLMDAAKREKSMVPQPNAESDQAKKEDLGARLKNHEELLSQHISSDRAKAGQERIRAIDAPSLAPAHPSSNLTKEELGVKLRNLEALVLAHTGWGQDPFGAEEVTYSCKKMTNMIREHCAARPRAKFAEGCANLDGPGLYDHPVCLDEFPPKDHRCLVYDMGIRQQPQFGEAMATYFGCEVHAFDPSPISLSWIDNSGLKSNPNYTFHPYGMGVKDGTVQHDAYDWGQISVVRPFNHWECDETRKKCKNVPPGGLTGQVSIQVKTLGTIMKENGHKWIDHIKIDVEGSEWSFISQALLEMGSLPTDQISFELHHFQIDPRYGAGSSPEISELIRMLQRDGFEVFHDHIQGGWSALPAVPGLGPARYSLLSMVRTKRLRDHRTGQLI